MSSFWARNPSQVAGSLTGRELRVGDKSAYILKAMPFERDQQEKGIYKPMLSMEAGQVYCPRFMNSILLLITTGRGQTLGSCVRIDEIELDAKRYEGAGRVAKALGITEAKATGWAKIVDDLIVEVDLDKYPLQSMKAKKGPKSKLPKLIFMKWLRQISDSWLKRSSDTTFADYLNDIRTNCETVEDLKKKIRS